ncbi:MAG: hypothetical protein ACLTZT_20060 [Butyricimonas faecalis]
MIRYFENGEPGDDGTLFNMVLAEQCRKRRENPIGWPNYLQTWELFVTAEHFKADLKAGESQ